MQNCETSQPTESSIAAPPIALRGSYPSDPSDDGRLGKYRIVSSLGSGGMAKVMLATTTGAGGIKKLVVLKKVRDDFAGDPAFLRMLLAEANVATRLSHPNVIHVYEVAEDSSQVFIAMEYVDGQSLQAIRKRLRDGEHLTLRHYVRVLCAVLDGLQYAHELRDYDGRHLRLVHRDVSPHNVLVSYDGVVKVVDFGIAKALDSGDDTRTGVLKGKVPYMSPEQARGESVDNRADVFAAGVMLWEGAARRRLWDGLENTAILGRLLLGETPIEPPSAVVADVPREIDSICAKALAWNRDDRFATALEFKRALERWLVTVEPVDERAIGEIVSAAFEAERAAARKVIEQSMMEGDDTVRFEPPRPDRASVPSLARAADDPAHPRRPSRWIATATLSGALAALAFGLAFPNAFHRVRRSEEGAARAASVPTAQRPISVALQTKPNDARLFLDSRELANPYAQPQARDGAMHLIRAEAPGYQPTVVEISFAADVSLELALEPVAAEPITRAAPAAIEERPKPATSRPPSRMKTDARPSSPNPASGPPTAKVDTDDMQMPRVQQRPGPPIDTELPWGK